MPKNMAERQRRNRQARGVVNAAEVGHMMGLSLRTMRRWIAAGRLPEPFPVPDHLRQTYLSSVVWRVTDITKWLDDRGLVLQSVDTDDTTSDVGVAS